ncbi:MAG: tetratricopeptide repeat protein [Bacteroidales bacterium]|nr:tetratricopeptide repeat protein [Bacteroidales bacterium]
MKYIFLLLISFSFAGLPAQDSSADSLLNNYKNTSNPKDKAESAINLGKLFLRNNPEKAFEFLNEALEISRELNLSESEFASLNLLGILKKNVGNYDEAIDFQIQALKIARKNKDKSGESVCLNNLGSIYQSQLNLDKAMQYFKESLAIEEKLGNKSLISLRLYNIGTIYEIKDSLEIAYTYYYNSLLIEQEINNAEGIYFAYYGLAGVDIKRGNVQQAGMFLEKALEIAEKSGDNGFVSTLYIELGKLYRAQKEYSEAILAIKQSLLFSEKINFRNEIKEGYAQLADLYYLTGDYKSAFEFQKKFTSLNDSINSVEINSKIAEIESKYQLDKKEQQIALNKEKEEILQQKANSEKRNRYFLLAILLFAIIFALANLNRIINDSSTLILLSLGVLLVLAIISIVLVYFSENSISFNGFFDSLINVFTLAVLPIFAFILIAERVLYSRNLKTAGEISSQIKNIEKKEETELIRLVADNDKNFVETPTSEFFFIEANDNYSSVNYFENDKLKKVLLRGSMKRMEEQLSGFECIVRCHKSYIVNINKISRVSGNAQGYKLHFNDIDKEIPVSRAFPRAFLEKIRDGRD